MQLLLLPIKLQIRKKDQLVVLAAMKDNLKMKIIPVLAKTGGKEALQTVLEGI